MNNTMEYKGYIGSVEFSEADQILYGKVQGIRSLISYEGTTVTELVEDFHSAVDDYLELCSAEGKTPEKAFKGSFNVRFKNPVLHKKAAVYAYNHSVSLNSVVEESVAEYLTYQQPTRYRNEVRYGRRVLYVSIFTSRKYRYALKDSDSPSSSPPASYPASLPSPQGTSRAAIRIPSGPL